MSDLRFRFQAEDASAPFSSSPMLLRDEEPVAKLVSGFGPAYSFDEGAMLTYRWKELVAQLIDGDLEYVVTGSHPRDAPPNDRSGGRASSGAEVGILSCTVDVRPGSYDHKRHHAALKAGVEQKNGARLPIWDFVLHRSDGSAIRLHPSATAPTSETYFAEGHATRVEPPASGLGGSEGPGTFRRYLEEGSLKAVTFSLIRDVQDGAPRNGREPRRKKK